jgi:hypothetical protein
MSQDKLGIANIGVVAHVDCNWNFGAGPEFAASAASALMGLC